MCIPTQNGNILLPAFAFPNNVLHDNLIGLAPICNAGCKITLTKHDIEIAKDGEIVWVGTKRPDEKLWHLNFADITPSSAVNARGNNGICASVSDPVVDSAAPLEHCGHALQTIRHDTDAEFVQFSHATFGSHPISTIV